MDCKKKKAIDITLTVIFIIALVLFLSLIPFSEPTRLRRLAFAGGGW